MEYTQNKERLFELIAQFSVDTVLGLISRSYSMFGADITRSHLLPKLLLPFVETYFNQCVSWVWSKSDQYFNERFAPMIEITLDGPNHPMDILNIIVILSLYLLNNMDIKDIIGQSKDSSMNAVKAHLQALVYRHKSLASGLNGCTIDHVHNPPSPTEKTFTFTIDQYVDTDQGSIKLTKL